MPKYYGRTNIFRHQEPTISIPVKIVFGGGKFFSNSERGSKKQFKKNKLQRKMKCALINTVKFDISVLDPDPDRIGSAFNWLLGSGSAFGMRIRIWIQKV
jgi:hypothetical protein